MAIQPLQTPSKPTISGPCPDDKAQQKLYHLALTRGLYDQTDLCFFIVKVQTLSATPWLGTGPLAR